MPNVIESIVSLGARRTILKPLVRVRITSTGCAGDRTTHG
jgi:hypothetical protein